MKIQFLGTAAAEGFPAVFCNCIFCQNARKNGGRDIRTRSQAMVNDDLLLDLPMDTYIHFVQNQISGDRIKYLFVTHSHRDHFFPEELIMRHGAYAHDMEVPVMQVYLNSGALRVWEQKVGEQEGIKVFETKPYECISLPEYRITPLPARHYPGDDALFYMIEQGGKYLLYAHDTGYFYEEVFEFLERQKIKFDMISLDCTYVDLSISDQGGHMGLENIGRLLGRLNESGLISPSTVKVINHFSHNADPEQEVLEKKVYGTGYLVAYDGMTISV